MSNVTISRTVADFAVSPSPELTAGQARVRGWGIAIAASLGLWGAVIAGIIAAVHALS
ncbi:hypothetical protein [Galbitalea soli]|uniref:Uncharacterized protein n=1 Tax=Galbitalea soli TaxID=1268042 RepID=A0A7C9PLJ8_9MICO|nr:hypothetical protein [Galbitalea soli]NEM90313.1 hypothetical protein [Galbitalea soli]NYJ31021.1 S1-C subfamily serine protease [Galbitalea soli]